MGAKNEHGAMGNFFDGFDKNGAAAAKLLNNISVVNNFMMHVDRRAVSFQGQFDDVHGAHHAGAKAARPDAEQDLAVPVVLVLHGHPFTSTPRTLSYLSGSPQGIRIPDS